MGFYFRKNFNFGPVRFNFSKSGVGVSTGVKGLRYSVGSRGAFINVGRNGFYYRKKLGSSFTHSKQFNSGNDHVDNSINEDFVENVENFTDSSSQEILAEVNTRAGRIMFAPKIRWVAVILGCALFLKHIDFETIITTIIGLFVFSIVIGLVDKARSTTKLLYELHDENAVRFNKIQEACSFLSQSNRLWQVENRSTTIDWKTSAGASSGIDLVPVTIQQTSKPPHIAANVNVWSISARTLQLFFFPDCLFVFYNKKYGVLSYEHLKIEVDLQRYVEEGSVPNDAQIVDYKWQNINRDGSPDRRYKNNIQIPVLKLGVLKITSDTGLDLCLYTSNPDLAQKFYNSFAAINLDHKSPAHTDRHTKNESEKVRSETAENINSNAYAVLGLNPRATPADITSAYRHMAQMYHPDKVTNLAPEFHELAERRMKEINAAYEQLKGVATLCPNCNGEIQRDAQSCSNCEQQGSKQSTSQNPVSQQRSDINQSQFTTEMVNFNHTRSSNHALSFIVIVVICFGLAYLTLIFINSQPDSEINREAVNLVRQILEAEQNSDDQLVVTGLSSIEAIPKLKTGNKIGAQYFNKIGLKELRTKKYIEAAKYFFQAFKADPSDPKYLSNLGFAEMGAGALAAAEKHLYESLAVAPSRSVAWGDLGEVFAKKGDQDKAVPCFLMGYRVSNGDTLKYLQSLQGDDDPAIRAAGNIALNKVQSTGQK